MTDIFDRIAASYRRERIADLWDAKWTAEKIAAHADIDISVRQVFDHVAALREAGDQRVPHRPQWSNQARVKARIAA